MGHILYRLAQFLVRIYLKVKHNWFIMGKDNVPEEGPIIIMANHISYLDPPVIGCLSSRHVHFMAKEELFKNPIAAWFFRTIGTIPVKRGKPDRRALKKAFQVIKDGKTLGLFPEGTRRKQGKLGKAKAGAIMIAIKSQVPILPVGLKITNKKRIKVSIGKSFTLDEYYGGKLDKNTIEKAGKKIMDKIKDEVERL